MNLTNVSSEVETHEFKINGEWQMDGTRINWVEIILPQHQDIRYSKVRIISVVYRRIFGDIRTDTIVLFDRWYLHCSYHEDQRSIS